MGMKPFILLALLALLASGGSHAAPEIPKGTSVKDLTAKYGKPIAKGCTPKLGDKEEYLIYKDFRVLTDQGKTILGAEDSEIDFDISKIRKRQTRAAITTLNQWYSIDVICF